MDLKNILRSTNKKIAFLIGLILLVAGGITLFQLPPSQDAPTASTIQPVKSSSQLTPSQLDAKINTLQERLKNNPNDLQAYRRLANTYIKKAHKIEDPTYLGKAEALLNKTMAIQSDDVEAMGLMGEICLARHQFRDALVWGERAKTLAPSSAYVYGIITDAHIELGNYEQAVESLQRMVDLRPDLSSYSRVSYVRELMGDVEGAIEAMNMAINAGRRGAEERAWCRAQLGHLYFNQGKLELADAEYRKALIEFPDYVHALAGRADVYTAQQNFPDAISIYKRISEALPLPGYAIALGDLYLISGEASNADQQYTRVRTMTEHLEEYGVNTDMEFAIFNAERDQDLTNALQRAHQAFEVRPSIYAADTLAWTLYKTGKYTEAYEMSRQALRLGTQDARLFFHTGMISKQLGKKKEARIHLEKALELNPHFSRLYADEAVRALQELHNNTSPKMAQQSVATE